MVLNNYFYLFFILIFCRVPLNYDWVLNKCISYLDIFLSLLRGKGTIKSQKQLKFMISLSLICAINVVNTKEYKIQQITQICSILIDPIDFHPETPAH